MISVIIPTYNSAGTLEKLLSSFGDSDFSDHEVIVVDDGSNDETARLLKRFPVRALKTPNNGGPSLARNVGARAARGDILLFLDSDVVLRADTLEEVRRFFENHPGRSVMVGIYDSTPANRGVWPLYKALQCRSYRRGFPAVRRVSLLWAAVAAFRKDVYLRSGGFDTRFDRPSMEDLELGRRISKNHPIYLNRNVVVRHHFPATLRRNAADHFHRGFLWVKLFFRYKRFDDYLSTPRRAIGRLGAFVTLPALAAALFAALPAPVAAAPFAVYLACNYDLWAVTAKRSLLFLPVVLAIDFLLGIVLGAALCAALFDEAVLRLKRLFHRRKKIAAVVVPDPLPSERVIDRAAPGSKE